MALTEETSTDLLDWQRKAALLKTLVAEEMALRTKVFAAAFPAAKVGVNNLPIGNGFILKAERKLNYNLKNTAEGQETYNAVEAIEKIGNEGQFLADRLVTWKPSLSLTEYKKLDGTLDANGKPNNPTHYQIKQIIDSVLTVTDGAPTLEIKTPGASA